MKRILKNRYKMLLLAAVFFLVFLSLISGIGRNAYAAFADSEYTDVLADLQKDEIFNVDEYPAVSGDNSLQVVQIAESINGELFIYVYQPGAVAFEYKACSINIAREQDNSVNLNFNNYGLTYLNNNGVFYKYKVENFEVNVAAVRYYNISNILRPWDRYLDINTGNDNTVSEVPFKVAQYWTVTGMGENVSYFMTTSEVITITEKYVGYVLYSDGQTIKWSNMSAGWTHAHFVAFSTDRQIDKLISVKMSFVEVPVTSKWCCNIFHTSGSNRYENRFDVVYGEGIEHKEHTIVYTDKGGNIGGGNYVKADPYAWYRIRTKDEFIADENNKDYRLTNGTTENIENTAWVLSFYETSFSRIVDDITLDADESYSRIYDVMILELEFETDGVTYKLGVVDNKQSGGSHSGNTSNNSDKTTVGQVFAYIWNCIKLVFSGKAGVVEYLVTFAVVAVGILVIVGIVKIIMLLV